MLAKPRVEFWRNCQLWGGWKNHLHELSLQPVPLADVSLREVGGTVILEFSQRAAPDGLINTARIHSERLSGVSDGTRQIDFQHVGVESMPEPQTLDGYVFGILFLAMRGGAERLDIRGPVSSVARRNAQYFGEAWQCWLPDDYRPVEIVAERVVTRTDQATTFGVDDRRACIAAFSGGADSTFSILRHASGELGLASCPMRDLVMVHGFDVGLANERHFGELIERTDDFVKHVGAELHVVRTNLKEASGQDWEHSFAAQLACVLHQFSGRFQSGLVASGPPYSDPLKAWGSTPGTDFLLSGDFFEIVHDGAGFTRSEKIEAIARDPFAIRSLKVCWEGENQGRNCGVCEKCVRTQLDFLAVGIPRPECFETPLKRNDIRSLTPRNIQQFRFLTGIVEFADSRGVEGEWLTLLKQRVAELHVTFGWDLRKAELSLRGTSTAELESMAAERDVALQRLAVIEASRSWRLTSWLRKARRALG